MSRIDALIAELCPDGVEFKALEELGVTYGGLTGKTKADFSDGNADLFPTRTSSITSLSILPPMTLSKSVLTRARILLRLVMCFSRAHRRLLMT